MLLCLYIFYFKIFFPIYMYNMFEFFSSIFKFISTF